MELRDLIKRQIFDYAESKGIALTNTELFLATNGVEYYITTVMPESIEVAVANILYDRKLNSKKQD
jgi:hypothetical protein